MTEANAYPDRLERARPDWLYRSADEGLLTGVSAGLAREFRTEPLIIRISLVLMSFAGGLGLIAYGALWALARQTAARSTAAHRDSVWRSSLGVILIAFGVCFLAGTQRFWFGGSATMPLLLAVIGSAVLWSRSNHSPSMESSPRAVALIAASTTPWRLFAGSLMVIAAVIAFVVSNVSLAMVGSVLVTLIAVGGGFLLLLGPLVARLISANQDANRQRIRSNERAEVSAHLHDSVLHTLALIQRSSTASAEVVSLARGQERDLRAWLQGRNTNQTSTLQEAVDELATAVEGSTGIVVESVVVGDSKLSEPLTALLAAINEAAVNAGKHSGAASVSVYVEVDQDCVSAFVRDAGRGFDRDAVDPNRRGIRESIEGRMKRNGGTSYIRSTPEGTEVELRLPVKKS